jgi:hypothetical protein
MVCKKLNGIWKEVRDAEAVEKWNKLTKGETNETTKTK